MSKIKEKIKSFLPDMKKAIERFPLTVFAVQWFLYFQFIL